MSGFIRSSFNDTELLEYSGKNQVYYCFELVGIMSDYEKSNCKEDFEDYYIVCRGEEKYHYRNVGVKEIYKILERKRCDGEEIPYRISKCSMRRFGITYCGSRIIVHEMSAVILKYLLEYIRESEVMNRIFENKIDKHSLLEFLDFQETFLERYIAGGGTRNRRRYADLREEIGKEIGVKS